MPGDRPPVIHPVEGPRLPFPERGVPAVVGGPLGGLVRLDGARVLVVEDDEDCRDLICSLLAGVGATVLCANSVAQAMDGVYHLFDPDVVVTDFSMPEADGFDLIREFRKAPSSRTVAVPILVLSGHTEESWRVRALAAGAEELLIKPFEPAFLLARIAAAVALGRRRAH